MRLTLTPKTFIRLFMIYLIDKINNPEIRPTGDEDLDDLFDKMKKIKADLTKFYLSTKGGERSQYRLIRRAFTDYGYSKKYQFDVYDGEDSEIVENINENINNDNELYKTKKVVKEVIKEMKKRKFYNARPISESELEKIIENKIKEK